MKRTITSIFSIVLALVMVLTLAACGGNDSDTNNNNQTTKTKEEMLEIANEISMSQLYDDAYDNLPRASDKYVNNTYKVWGEIYNINSDSVEIMYRSLLFIKANLPSDELKKLNKGNCIQVVGTISEINNVNDSYVYAMENAYFVTDEYEIKNASIVDAVDNWGGKYTFTIDDENFDYIYIKCRVEDRSIGQTDTYPKYVISAKGKFNSHTMETNDVTLTKK